MTSCFYGKKQQEILKRMGDWWTQFQKINRPGKIELLKSLRESRSGPVEKKFGFLEELS
jgi:hypothetical protein